ncbi:M20 family metallopeptidase [Actinocorallia sp. B10E7]|uniref:M20 metallopeptidase family protein n=1 Tax=Actinocorallia sp. B10E7 TaxID=3153558 RepID=UPI00325F45F4
MPPEPDETLHRKLRTAVADEIPAAIELRHRLHAEPRISGQEEDTAREVVAALDAGPGERVAGTGRLLRIGGEGPAVVLRAELDALPMTERTGAPWSATGAAMHACGHDVHLAALVAVCRAAARIGPDVPILALLQPREETHPSGAEDVVRSGVLEGAIAVVGAHVQPRLPAGVVGATPGPVNAAADEFEIVVTGAGGHAGYPHLTRDPVLAVCQVVVALQHLASRRFDPVLGASCTVGHITGGSAANVVPDTAAARGTVRVMRDEDRAEAARLITEIAAHTAAAFGCTAETRIHPLEPVLRNDPDLADRATGVLNGFGIPVDRTFRSYGADDFSHYCHGARGLMLFVGTDPSAPGLHHPAFLPGDEVVGRVADALVAGYLAAAT